MFSQFPNNLFFVQTREKSTPGTPPRDPKIFEKVTTPNLFEKLKVYFGPFFITSLGIVIFQKKVQVKNANIAKLLAPLCILF